MSLTKALSLFFVSNLSVMAFAEMVVQHAQIKNLVSNAPGCEGKTTITYNDDGSVEVLFNDIVASRESEQPFAKCLLQGEVVVPAGFYLATSQFADAQFKTQYAKPGDQSGGRFRLDLNDAVSSSIAMSDRSHEHFEDTTLTLKNAIPSFKACGTERVLPLRLTVEAMINYRLDEISSVSSRLEAIRLPSLRILPTSCSEDSP